MFCFYAFLTIMSWFAYLGATHLVKKGVVELISIAPSILFSVSAVRRDLVSIFFFFHLLVLELIIAGYILLVLVPTNKADVVSASSMALVPSNTGRVTGHPQGSTSGNHGAVNIFSSFGVSLGYTESDPVPSMPGAYPNTVDISTAIPGLDSIRNLGLTILSRILALVTWGFDFFNTVRGLWVVPWEQPTLQLFAFQVLFEGPIKHTYYAPGSAHTGKENTNDQHNDEVKNEPSTHNPSQVDLHILLCIEWAESTAVEPTAASAGAILIESDSFQDDELDRTLVEDTYSAVKRPTSAPPIMNEIDEEVFEHELKCCISAAGSLPILPSASLESTLPANTVNPEPFQNKTPAEAAVFHSLVVKRSRFTLNADAASFIPASSESSSPPPAPSRNLANQEPSRIEISAGGISSFTLNASAASFIPASQSIAPAVLPKVVESSPFKMNADAAPFVPLPPASAPAPPKPTFGPTCLPLCPHRNDPPSYWSPGGTVIPITTPSGGSALHDPVATTSANGPPDFWAPGRSLDDAAIRIVVPSPTRYFYEDKNQNSTIHPLPAA
ncbi:hypothetical protein R3P38DRAFT_3250292 [Favolaschia claudopus]|uniref:Uncharacterized protein n=1 Tax=Favolaschia claudopus TaxID=2862362 RepID=A0AAW0EIZ1_9AGAR